MKSAIVGGQLARRLGLPYRSSNANTANSLDAQAAYESVFSLWGAIMGGANFLMHGAGWMEGGLQASFEKMALDADLLAMVAEFLKPVRVDKAELALDAIREVGPGGHFFGAARAQSRYRTAFFAPMISDWRNSEAWREAGSPTAVDAAEASSPSGSRPTPRRRSSPTGAKRSKRSSPVARPRAARRRHERRGECGTERSASTRRSPASSLRSASASASGAAQLARWPARASIRRLSASSSPFIRRSLAAMSAGGALAHRFGPRRVLTGERLSPLRRRALRPARCGQRRGGRGLPDRLRPDRRRGRCDDERGGGADRAPARAADFCASARGRFRRDRARRHPREPRRREPRALVRRTHGVRRPRGGRPRLRPRRPPGTRAARAAANAARGARPVIHPGADRARPRDRRLGRRGDGGDRVGRRCCCATRPPGWPRSPASARAFSRSVRRRCGSTPTGSGSRSATAG